MTPLNESERYPACRRSTRHRTAEWKARTERGELAHELALETKRDAADHPGMWDERESAVLRDLDRAVRSAAARIDGVVARVREHLALHPGSKLAWEPIPLSVYGPSL